MARHPYRPSGGISRDGIARWRGVTQGAHAGSPANSSQQWELRRFVGIVGGRSHGAASDSGGLIFHGICAPAIRLPAGALAPRPMTPAVPFPACPVRSRGRGGWLQQAPTARARARTRHRSRVAPGRLAAVRRWIGPPAAAQWRRNSNVNRIPNRFVAKTIILIYNPCGVQDLAPGHA